MKNKFVAAALAFFLGMFGAHKFYLRDPGAGVFYIMLMVMTSRFLPISLILGFFDGLRYLMMSPSDFDKKFNNKYYKERPRTKRTSPKSNREYYEVKKPRRVNKKIVRSNPFKKSGVKKYKEYEIEEALEDFKKGLKIEPNDVALLFNMACAYSLLENKEDAYEHLALAVQHGFTDFEKIQSHDDLAFVRIQPEYDDFKAGGFKLSNTVKPKVENVVRNEPMDDVLLSQLNRLMELRKKGVLTENEFIIERKKILARS